MDVDQQYADGICKFIKNCSEIEDQKFELPWKSEKKALTINAKVS